KTISARAGARGTASLVIEATDPVAYVTARPDPLTLLVDLRNVAADGVANTVSPEGRGPIAGVSIEPVESLGAPASRVRIALTQPVAHHVRSDRNSVIVDFDRPKGAPYVLPPTAADRSSTGDAMAALQQQQPDVPAVDPIAALGLDDP